MNHSAAILYILVAVFVVAFAFWVRAVNCYVSRAENFAALPATGRAAAAQGQKQLLSIIHLLTGTVVAPVVGIIVKLAR